MGADYQTVKVRVEKSPPAKPAKTETLIYTVDFKKGANGFGTYETKNLKAEYIDGEYRLTHKVLGVWWVPLPLTVSPRLFTDFSCEIDVQSEGNDGRRGWGLGLLPAEPPSHPWTGVQFRNDGQVSIHLYDYKKLLPWMTTTVMRPAPATNTARIEVKNKLIRLTLNGTLVAETKHDGLRPSTLSLYTFGDHGPTEIRIHRMRIWRMEEIGTPPPPGAFRLEAENLTVLGKSQDFDIVFQDMRKYLPGKWSADGQMFANPKVQNAWTDLELPIAASGNYEVIAFMTQAKDYGDVRFSINGRPAGRFDGYAPRVAGPVPYLLGTFALMKGPATLRLHVIGKHPNAPQDAFSWGLDCLELTPIK